MVACDYTCHFECYLHLQQNIVKEEIGADTLGHMALETMNTRCPPDKCLHIFTDGSQMDGYATGTTFDFLWWRNGRHTQYITSAELTPEQILNSCYLFWLKYCNTICGINRNCDINRNQRLPPQIRQLRAKHKQTALQWIPGHCQIAGNEYADALAKKGAKITQTHIVETCYRSIKLHLNRCFKVYTDMS